MYSFLIMDLITCSFKIYLVTSKRAFKNEESGLREVNGKVFALAFLNSDRTEHQAADNAECDFVTAFEIMRVEILSVMVTRWSPGRKKRDGNRVVL